VEFSEKEGLVLVRHFGLFLFSTMSNQNGFGTYQAFYSVTIRMALGLMQQDFCCPFICALVPRLRKCGTLDIPHIPSGHRTTQRENFTCHSQYIHLQITLKKGSKTK